MYIPAKIVGDDVTLNIVLHQSAGRFNSDSCIKFSKNSRDAGSKLGWCCCLTESFMQSYHVNPEHDGYDVSDACNKELENNRVIDEQCSASLFIYNLWVFFRTGNGHIQLADLLMLMTCNMQ